MSKTIQRGQKKIEKENNVKEPEHKAMERLKKIVARQWEVKVQKAKKQSDEDKRDSYWFF